MKKTTAVITIAFLSVALCAATAFAQQASVRAGNATLVSWTVDDVENGMKDKVSNVAMQPTGNERQFTLTVTGGENITFKLNTVTKQLHQTQGGELILSTDKATLGESGSNQTLTFTDKNGVKNILKFRKK